MKLATSNIALNPGTPVAELRAAAEFGFTGLEVASSRVWDNQTAKVTPAQVTAYRREVETAGLQVVGMHSLFWDEPELGLFKGADIRARTLDFLTHLSGICRDLGGRTLIYGSQTARTRGDLPLADAVTETIDFFGELDNRIDVHGTTYCFEPLAPKDGDFINSVQDSLDIVERLNKPALGLQIDAKALVANNEATLTPFMEGRDRLVHFHANEPDLGVIGSSGEIDHALLGQCLRDIGYEGYVSNEQRMLNGDDPLPNLAKSFAVLSACYLEKPV
jgi:sugar phosphate isomerase/epimerase